MADAVGILSKASFHKDRGLYGAGPQASYPETAASLPAERQIPFSAESMVEALERQVDEALVGSGITTPSDVTGRFTTGSVEGRLRYRGWERMLMCAMGFEYPDQPGNGSPAFLGSGAGTQAVTNATNATPIVVTVASHGYSNGDGIRIVGVTGNTAANGDWAIDNVTTNTFELHGSVGNGAYISGGTADLYSAFAHLFEMDETLQDEGWLAGERAQNPHAMDLKVRRGALAIYKQVSEWASSSVMVDKCTISGTPQGVDVAFDLIGYDLIRGAMGQASWSVPPGSLAQSLFQQAVCKLGTRSGGAGALATLAPSSFEITIENNLKGDDQTTGSGENIIIPLRSGMRAVKVKFEFPRYNSDLWPSYFDLNTELACSIILTGPEIIAGQNYKMGFYMSSCRLSANSQPVPGAGPLLQSFEIEAHRPSGTDIFDTAGDYQSIDLIKDSELRMMIHNDDAHNYLNER